MGRYSFMPPRSNTHWFRVGSLDVTTTALVTALACVPFVIYAVSREFVLQNVLDANGVLHGRVWELVIWPLVNYPLAGVAAAQTLWTVLAIYIFWWIGSNLEGALGRTRFLRLLILLTAVPSVGITLFALATGWQFNIGQPGMVVFWNSLIATYAATYPRAKFFGGIDFALVAGAIVAVNLLGLIGDGAYAAVVFVVLCVATGLIAAKAFGLSTVAWIPRVPVPSFVTGDTRAKQEKKRRKAAHLHVVQEADVDSLLDKIAEQGIDSLTPAERRRLDERSRRDN